MPRRIAATTIIFFFFLCSPAVAQSHEIWASLTKDKSLVLTLKSDGTAEYEQLFRGSNGKLHILRASGAKWGTYNLEQGVTWSQLAGRGTAKRYFWVKVNLPDGGATFDFAQIGERVLEVDKTGVVSSLSRIEDGPQK